MRLCMLHPGSLVCCPPLASRRSRFQKRCRLDPSWGFWARHKQLPTIGAQHGREELQTLSRELFVLHLGGPGPRGRPSASSSDRSKSSKPGHVPYKARIPCKQVSMQTCTAHETDQRDHRSGQMSQEGIALQVTQINTSKAFWMHGVHALGRRKTQDLLEQVGTCLVSNIFRQRARPAKIYLSHSRETRRSLRAGSTASLPQPMTCKSYSAL